MRTYFLLVCLLITNPVLAKIQERALEAGQPSSVQDQGLESDFPRAKSRPTHPRSSEANSTFPAPRHLLESAAEKCSDEVAQIWAQQNALEPYKRSHFQKCIGEASQRCKKLKQLAESMKLADEELFSYQQAVLDAQKVFQ